MISKIASAPIKPWNKQTNKILYNLIYNLFHIRYSFSHEKDKPKHFDDASLKIISDRFAFIYVGVPLVGTRSIHNIFLNQKTDVNIGIYKEKKPLRILYQEKPHLRDYYKFSFVRNPLKRVVSCYNKKILNANTLGKINLISKYRGLSPQMPFEKFVEWLCAEEGSDNFADRHWLSQSIVLDYPDKWYPKDEIFDIETFQYNMEYILHKIGLNSCRFSQMGTSQSMDTPPLYKSYNEYYNHDLIAKIGKRYQRDFELFKFNYDTITS